MYNKNFSILINSDGSINFLTYCKTKKLKIVILKQDYKTFTKNKKKLYNKNLSNKLNKKLFNL